MKLALFTVLAINVAASGSAAVVEDDAGGVRGMIPKLLDVLNDSEASNQADPMIDVEEHCDSCQPDYCFEDPDFRCYK